MLEIDDLHGTGKMLIGQVPNPFGSVTDDHFLYGTAPAAVPGFQIDALAEILGGRNGSGVSGRIQVSNGITFLVPSRLRKHAAQFDLASVGGLAIGFSLAPIGLFLHHRHTGSVHLHVQDRNRLTHDYGQVQLDGLANLVLLGGGDISTDRLGCALHRFGGHLQSSEYLHLLAAVIEGRRLSHNGLHTAPAGRTVTVFHVQQAVGGQLPVVTVRT